MWKFCQIALQDYDKYIHNNIFKLFIVDILHYAEQVHEIHELAKYLPPPLMKGIGFESDNWDVREK